MRDWGRPPALTPAQQFNFLKVNPLCVGRGILTPRGLTWNYAARPSPLSREYQVELKLERAGTPDVAIKSPNIQALAGDREIPHVYHNPLRLCLYLPRANEWTDTMRLDSTIVPWTTVWLFYFEEWLISDDWKGGGEHPLSDQHYSRHVRRSVG